MKFKERPNWCSMTIFRSALPMLSWSLGFHVFLLFGGEKSPGLAQTPTSSMPNSFCGGGVLLPSCGEGGHREGAAVSSCCCAMSGSVACRASWSLPKRAWRGRRPRSSLRGVERRALVCFWCNWCGRVAWKLFTAPLSRSFPVSITRRSCEYLAVSGWNERLVSETRQNWTID